MKVDNKKGKMGRAVGRRWRSGLQLWHREPEVHHLSFHMYVRESPKNILKLTQTQILGMKAAISFGRGVPLKVYGLWF